MHCRHRGQVAGEPLDGQYADAMRRVHGSAGALTPTGAVNLAGTLLRMYLKLTRRGRSYPTRDSAQPPRMHRTGDRVDLCYGSCPFSLTKDAVPVGTTLTRMCRSRM
jgi:hypothetical protein